jgi:hypothetical protein
MLPALERTLDAFVGAREPADPTGVSERGVAAIRSRYAGWK